MDKIALNILLKKLNVTLNDLDTTDLYNYLSSLSQNSLVEKDSVKAGYLVYNSLSGM